MKILSLIVFALCLLSSQAFSSVEINGLDFKSGKNKGTLVIDYKGVLRGDPEMKISGKSIEIFIPNSKVKKSIERSVSFSSKHNDTLLKAYQSTKSKTKIKADFAFNVEKKSDLVSLTIRDNRIELNFPRVAVALKSAPEHTSIKTAAQAPVKKEFLNEAYLNNLLKIEKKPEVAKKAKELTLKKKDPLAANDNVNVAQASTSKAANTFGNSKSKFNLLEYVGKFVAFLGLILLLFYGVVTLMKKGFIKKGKLGFLNNTDLVSVISTTYIAPKKSLMLVKAHNQVFLVSNTDSGIHPISEIRDVAGLFKGGEKTISGQNFDTNFITAEADDQIEDRVKLKEDITISNRESAKASYKEVKEKVKFSDQLKKKVQNLKPLQ